LVWRLGQA